MSNHSDDIPVPAQIGPELAQEVNDSPPESSRAKVRNTWEDDKTPEVELRSRRTETNHGQLRISRQYRVLE